MHYAPLHPSGCLVQGATSDFVNPTKSDLLEIEFCNLLYFKFEIKFRIVLPVEQRSSSHSCMQKVKKQKSILKVQ